MRIAEVKILTYLKGRPPGEKRFLLLVPAVGLGTGLLAAAMIHVLAGLQKMFWGSGHELVESARGLPPLHRFLAPVLGGLAVGLLILWNRRIDRGRGTTGIIEAVARNHGVLSVWQGLKDMGAMLLTVGSGGSLGREGGLVRGGATLGSFLGTRVGLTGTRLKILVACGSAAGIAAAYNAPIGGAMFAMEVILGSFALEHFGPIVVSSAIGTIVSRSLIASQLAYTPPEVSPLVSFAELGLYMLLGLGVGLASVLFIMALKGVAFAFKRSGIKPWLRPLAGFAIVGAIGIRFPEVFGNGYDTTDRVLHGTLPLSLLPVLPFLKVLATASTRGSGGSGGLFTPTLFLGSLLGSAYGVGCTRVFPRSTAAPTAYALAGMGAILAGTTQAPLTAILMIFELTGQYEILLPLMAACTTSIVVCRLLGFESIYTQPLTERGVHVGLLVGELSAGDIFTIYNQEILHKEARLARFVRAGVENRPETTYVELPSEYVVALVTLPASFEGATLRELSPRARFGVNIIEVTRKLAHGGERRIIPDPETPLLGGDGLIVVGRPIDIAQLGDPLRLGKRVE